MSSAISLSFGWVAHFATLSAPFTTATRELSRLPTGDDPNTEAEYAVIQDGQIRLCSVDYDKTGVRRLVESLHGQLLEADHAKLMRRVADSRRI